MREYKPKNDLQKKQYYSEKFYIAKQTPKEAASGSKFDEELAVLEQSGVEILSSYVEFDQLVLYVNSSENFKTLDTLKGFGYEQLCELAAVDLIAQKGGYEVFYQLLSITKNRRTRVKCFVKKDEMLKSVCELYKSANWAEREMYDLSGVLIKDHPNLKRLIMPDDWHSHPLLKSYPLVGDEAAKWYEVDKIFGSEFREQIGEENRDPAFVDEKDTFGFSRVFSEEYEYQEEGGVRFVKKAKFNQSQIVKERP
ncbi:MAG: NADH-quinone oxidoreductase subunit C [Campylobacter concisus]|uniref:NADH-quinone oxidoreductase subunit C n=1 Tax=Campylobacter concisus TaxID=199 RepID=UPI000D307021|nr:NADH-quinone oxidoreductase subunit C [Campylobacter concisus]MBS6285916.1 NADH-quinone oxidoreductase subunit C [Campylobacter concisus]